MLICGVIFGVIIISAAQFLKVPKINAATIKESSINTSGCEVSPLQMIKSSLFILIFFTYFIAMIAGMMSIGHIVAFMQGKNFSEIQ